MLLAVDVGNTQTHLGVFRGAELVCKWRISTDARRTADELALTFRELLSLGGIDLGDDVSAVVIASVVPSATGALKGMVRGCLSIDPLVVGPGTRTGMAVATDNPREVGADRIANAVAAYALFGGPAIVIDFGTATTFDALGERGEYLGGAIAPGIEISARALAEAAAQIHKVELVRPASVIGKSTVEAVRSGVLLGAAAMVDGMVERMARELGGPAVLVATGGLAPLVIEGCSSVIEYEPVLTLTGLRLIHERNV